MKSKLLFGSTLMVLCGMVTPPVCVTTWAAEPATASTASGRLPSDLARATTGTRLQVREPNHSAVADEKSAAQALIGEDAAKAYSLTAGTTSMILSLPKIEVVNHFDFVTAGAEGKVTVSVSSAKLPFDSADWRVVASGQGFDGRQLIPCDLGSVEARYVKVDFNTNKAGNISGFNLFGMTDLGTTSVTKGSFHVTLNTASDAKVDANFSYDPADPAPKVVADLGSAHELKRITCAYEAPVGRLDFYLVDTAEGVTEPLKVGINYVAEPSVQPVSNDAADAADANVLAGHKVLYSVETSDQTGTAQAAAELKGLKGRYLVAAFRPATRHRGDYKDFKNVRDMKDGKDKQAPVFPAFMQAPSGFGNAPANVDPPLLPPPLGAGSP